jgi:uncharacterized protein YlxW (UPF0749 family)
MNVAGEPNPNLQGEAYADALKRQRNEHADREADLESRVVVLQEAVRRLASEVAEQRNTIDLYTTQNAELRKAVDAYVSRSRPVD